MGYGPHMDPLLELRLKGVSSEMDIHLTHLMHHYYHTHLMHHHYRTHLMHHYYHSCLFGCILSTFLISFFMTGRCKYNSILAKVFPNMN